MFFWLFTLVAVLASFLVPDTHDALFGQALEVQSAGFFMLMAVTMSLTLIFTGSKSALLKLGLLSGASALAVFLALAAQLFFGLVLVSGQSSLIGSLNDLALYAGFVLVVMLVMATRLDSSLIMKSLTSFMALAALFVLAVVNFSFLWVLIGFCSLLSFLYLVSKDTWLKSADESPEPPVSRSMLAMVAIICLISVSFIVSGDYLGAKVGQLTGISYLEVRPSLEATLEIATAVYQENAFFGSGPNRFEDTWRLYKNPVINETGYWNTTFISGHGFVSTVLITTGLSGLVLLLAFMLAFLYSGYRLFFSVNPVDAGWRVAALVTFVSAVYLWTTTFFYTPGPVIMLLTAIMTGLTLAIVAGLKHEKIIVLNVHSGRQYGFMMIGGILIMLVTAATLYTTLGRQFVAQLIFAEAGEAFTISYDSIAYDQKLQQAASYDAKQDIYAAERARLRLIELNRLLVAPAPTAAEQERFGAVLVEGIALAEQAIALDGTNPNNHALLGSFYGLINARLYEGVAARREAAFGEAEWLDPTNPEYLALQAQAAARFGDVEQARIYLDEAIKLKNNYTDALFLLSQLDIEAGNATSAIAITESIIAIEPRNPARYFQLGLLHLAIGSYAPAIEAFQIAITLDPQYANARYMLALAYLDNNEPELALAELTVVAQSNPDNEELKRLLTQVEGGDYTNPPLGYTVPLPEVVEGTEVRDGQNFEDTNLISPVNEVPKAESTEDSESTLME